MEENNGVDLKTIQNKLDEIKHISQGSTEYWYARELMPLLGYDNYWENFSKVIHKAQRACISSSIDVNEHFRDVTKVLEKTNQHGIYKKEQNDIILSRYACYLVAQNSDPRKVEVGLAQTYFAQQTYKQENFEKLSKDGKRLLIRNKVLDSNKNLASSAKKSGVINFGSFHDAGYKGLYGMSAKDLAKKKKIGKDKLMDRASETELAANLFRITQTDDQLKQKLDTGEVIGEPKAIETHHIVGKKVRKAIKDIGGRMPENLPVEDHIKNVKKELKEINKNLKL